MPRRPEIGNVQLYPNRPLRRSDRNGYVLKFYCPIRRTRIRRNCGTRDRREARRILRECRERLLNGEYAASGGAVTEDQAPPHRKTSSLQVASPGGVESWQDCFDRYRRFHESRLREKSLADTVSRLNIAERIFECYREDQRLPEGLLVSEVMTLDMLEYLQDRLLAGDECRYDSRSPNTVNSMMGVVMAFVRFCDRHEWIDRVPRLEKLDVDDVMKGRPITGEEFERMLASAPKVVGRQSAPSWQFALRVLWESAFRVGDLMDFAWEDDRHIHPVWPARKGQHPTIIVPPSQKNGRAQEIPMLPALCELLNTVPQCDRAGWIVNPQPIDYGAKSGGDWIRPADEDLRQLAVRFSNQSIAAACGVSDTAVRKWLEEAGLRRQSEFRQPTGRVPEEEVRAMHARAGGFSDHAMRRSVERLTKERVGRVIAAIGKEAGVVVQKADADAGRREKFASAHDLRRGCAQRLINAGVSAETLKVVMRHRDFGTTEKHYGATRSAQSAAGEVAAKFAHDARAGAFVGD